MPMSPEKDFPSIEERQFELDEEIRRREIVLKEAAAWRKWVSVAGVVLALIAGVIGALLVAWRSQSIEARKARENITLEAARQASTDALERKKLESALIAEAIKAGRAEAIGNLKLFVEAGLVPDPEGRIAKLGDAHPLASAASP